MHKIFLTTLIAMGLSLGTTAFSQETATPAEPTETTATQPADEAVNETATNAEANAEDQDFPIAKDPKTLIGTEFVKSEHEDWKIICTFMGEGIKLNCRLYQLLKNADGVAVAELSILALQNAEQAAAGVSFVSPLGTLLTAQVGMRIDAGAVKRYPFNWCEKMGCIARFGLTTTELGNMKKGNKAVVSIAAVATPKTPISLEVSLSGFTAGWEALSAEE